MDILKDKKLLIIAMIIVVLAEAMGSIKIGMVIVFPMLYAMILGGVVSLPKFKILTTENMNRANIVMSIALVLLVAKLGTSVGASWEKITQASIALVFQEVGHFIGTILLGLPLALMLGMGREAVGATYSIGREPNIAVVEAKYGLDSAEGRGVMAMYICGTLYGAVWMGILASVLASMNVLNPYEPPAESPDNEYDLWLTTIRVLEHWHTGTMTRRVPELHRAFPQGMLFMSPADAQRRQLRRGDRVRVITRRGEMESIVETRGRNKMPDGVVATTFFDAAQLANALTIDATDPLSKETDFKKCAARVVKA